MTSATRSVPVEWSVDVMTASKPASFTTFAISLASVATTRRSQTPSSATRRVTTMTRGSPPSGRSGLRGSRLEPSRAGITPRTGTGEDTKFVPLSLPLSYHLALRSLMTFTPRRPHDLAAERLTDRLMAEAHAQHRHLAGECPNQGDKDARLRGRLGTGREHRGGGLQRLHLGDAQRVVPIDNGILSQLAKILDEVVGEGVVIVEHEQHAQFY